MCSSILTHFYYPSGPGFLGLTPGLKIGSSQYPSHLHNNSKAQTITANSQSPITTGNSEHTLYSENAFRGM